MKKYQIQSEMEILSSHSISVLGYSGSNTYRMVQSVEIDGPIGYKNTNVKISAAGSSTFQVAVETLELTNTESQIKFLKDLSVLLSFLIGKDEKNGNTGTPFVSIDYRKFRATFTEIPDIELDHSSVALSDAIFVGDHLETTMITKVEIESSQIKEITYHELLSTYHDGLKAESEKSKYFHWFLVLEFLENTDLYNKVYPRGRLFNEDETNKITQLASTMAENKKSALLNCLARTELSRAQKLVNLLHSIDINKICLFQEEAKIDTALVRSIVDARNKLFHRGSEFPSKTLWERLFPLTTRILERLLESPDCLNAPVD
ncbi:hypothetical protein [Pseudomonas sp. PDM13]|uniref:hypothetical protein n=1 Tax=Pseudomonas sp. PDM13 TaxID=2769255 RepID=UPI0021DFBC9F|nr:hypothetical protein [Pseudomonas sp. PDM13]MCU9951553.1 hypothetical protein [Pseudomonas sp. PDM13]